MSLFEWDESLATGVEEIDEGHMLLFTMLNELHEQVADDPLRQEALQKLEGIKACAEYHFAEEESLLRDYRTPTPGQPVSSAREHLDRLALMGTLATAQERTEARDTLQSLAGWLREHIQGTGQQYRDTIALND